LPNIFYPTAFAVGDQLLRRWIMTSQWLDEVAAHAAF
jgi:hypothetical protein